MRRIHRIAQKRKECKKFGHKPILVESPFKRLKSLCEDADVTTHALMEWIECERCGVELPSADIIHV